MTGIVVMCLMVVLLTVVGRVQSVGIRLARPLAGCGLCDPAAGCGHMHYGGPCPRCGCRTLTL